MLVVADIAIGASEFKGNIFIGSKDTPCTVNRSVGLVVCGKCENKRVIGCKMCELVLRQNGRCKCGGVDVVSCEVCVSNIIRFGGGEVCVMIEDTFLHISGHIGNTILRNVARLSTMPADSFVSLAISPIKIFKLRSKSTPSTPMTTSLVGVQKSLLFNQVIRSRIGRVQSFIFFKFLECSCDFFNRRLGITECEIGTDGSERGIRPIKSLSVISSI